MASINSLRSAKGYLAISRSLLQYTPSGRGYYSALLDAIAAHALNRTMLALRRAAYIRPQVRCLATTPTTQKRWGPPTPPNTTNLPRGCLVGSVVSTAMAKTVNVDVTRTKIVPKYRKARRYSRRFLAHDENQECSLGDVVRIAPCRPLSRRKHFVVQEILKRN